MNSKNNQSYITKHKKYIDYRIKTISNYVSSHSNRILIISQIIKILTDDLPHNKPLNGIIKCNETLVDLFELKSIIDNWEILKDGDIVGYIYQEIQHLSDKKQKGQYFTPGEVVDYIVQKSLNQIQKTNIQILDPACGSGQFLISIFKHLKSKSNLTNKEIITNCIFGFDIDDIAIQIAKYNLHKISGCPRTNINIQNLDYLYIDDLNFSNKNFMQSRYDLIIGNPPWRSKFTSDEKKYYRKKYFSIQSGLNTFTLFIERSFKFIKSNGIISFLIPEAYLNIKVHRSSRQLVLDKTAIKDIAIWGEKFKGVFAPSISITLKKEKDILLRNQNIVQINTGKNEDQGTATLVPQDSYNRTHENIFNINYSKKAVNILSTIKNHNCIYLKDSSKFYLGIVTGNNEKFLSKEQTEQYPDPILTGRDLSQYQIDFSNNYFKFDSSKLQQVAPQSLYTTKNKILYKFIGKRLTFALDNHGYYTLNNINGIIQNFNNLNIESTLSVLNSKVIQYYYEKCFFTVKVLRGNLEEIPIKILNKNSQEKLKQYVHELMNSTVNEDQKGIRENIEDIIYYEYGIKDKEAYVINS